MILEKNLALELPNELLEKAHLQQKSNALNKMTLWKY